MSDHMVFIFIFYVEIVFQSQQTRTFRRSVRFTRKQHNLNQTRVYLHAYVHRTIGLSRKIIWFRIFTAHYKNKIQFIHAVVPS